MDVWMVAHVQYADGEFAYSLFENEEGARAQFEEERRYHADDPDDASTDPPDEDDTPWIAAFLSGGGECLTVLDHQEVGVA